jgi:cell division septation protein DedD
MSVRYTAVAGMAEADKLELKLDNRQVFFLFFGSAVVACMLFVLGVMVGKRIESRGQAEAAPALQDPLAALDRARQPPAGVAAPDSQLSFPSSLLGGAGAGKSPAHAAAPKPAKPAPIAAPKPVAMATPKPAAVAAPKLAVVAPPKPIVPAAAKPLVPAAAKPVAAKPVVASGDAPKPRGKYTLQLSTFATAEDAQTFVDHYPGAFVVAGDVPGKGTTYRVRYGNFASYQEATAAKESFEKQHNMIALVAAR